MPTSRDVVLEALRKARPTADDMPDAATLPDLAAESWATFEDPWAQFEEVLTAIGGSLHRVDSIDEADAAVRSLDAFSDGTDRVSLVRGVGETTFDFAGVTEPRGLRDVELAVLPAAFAVAENGAVWVPCEDALDRTLGFLSQHVAFVIDGRDRPAGEPAIVHTMHEAYRRADPRSCRFSVFVAGPSKTADIEQSLVIGAHGARSLAVIVVG